MKIKFFILIQLLCFVFYVPALSQIKKNVKTITTRDGLIQNDVNSIFQDSEGYMWLATNGGLNRYDGMEFLEVRLKNLDYNTPNLFWQVTADSYNRLWFSIANDAIMYDPRTEQFESISKSQGLNLVDNVSVYFDTNNLMWLFTGTDVFRFRLNYETRKYVLDRKFEMEGVVRAINNDSENNLLVATSKGLSLVRQDEVVELQTGMNVYSIASDNISTAIATSSGVYKVSIDLQKNAHFQKVSSLQASSLIYLDEVLYMGTKQGVYTCTQREDLRYNIAFINLNEKLIVRTLAKDNNGQIWAGIYNGGVRIINPQPQKFTHIVFPPKSDFNNKLRSMCEDKYGNLWLGTNGEGIGFVPRGGDFVRFFQSVDLISESNNAHYMVPVDDHLYVVNDNLIKISYQRDEEGGYVFSQKIIPTGNGTTNIMVIRPDPNGKYLWLGTYRNTIYRYDLRTEEIVALDVDFNRSFEHPAFIRNIIFDRFSNMWIATSKGLIGIKYEDLFRDRIGYRVYKNDPDDPSTLSYDYLLSLFIDNSDNFWIGTFGGGLCKTKILDNNLNLSAFDHLTVDDGLPNNSIKSIEQDANGMLWMSTNYGICKIDPVSEQITNYGLYDGLQDYEFGELCSAKLRDGRIAFGGVNGMNIFNPFNIVEDENAPNITLTKFTLLNEDVSVGDVIANRVLLEQALNKTSELELRYDENSFSISFSALHFVNPLQNRYSYLLRGFDQRWNHVSATERTAKYTNLPPGRYQFVVRASNSDGQWSKNKIITIIINKAWWKTNLALCLYALLLVIIVYVVYSQIIIFQRNRLRLRVSEMENAKIEEMANMRVNFFTNISHEFRTPLSLIITPVKQLISNPRLDKKQTLNLYNLINHNADILFRLINNLLDFSKFEQGQLTVKSEWRDVVAFSSSTLSQFDQLALQHNVSLEFESNVPSLDFYCDYSMLEHILYNILSNALKHTPSKGKVSLNISVLDSSNFQIVIKDTGRGIDEKIINHLFERFVNSDADNIGTGLGLAYTKDLVELNGGTITFETQKEQGTEFFIKFPISLTQKQKDDDVLMVEGMDDSKDASSFDYNIDNYIRKNKYTLLLVEDNISILTYMEDYFKGTFRVVTAQDGQEGLDACFRENPDIIISDIMMPNMDGTQMCQQLKTLPQTSHIPIIMLTAMTKTQDQIKGYSVGADAYCSKPFDIEVLNALVLSLVDNRKKLREQFQSSPEINVEQLTTNNIDEDIINKCISFVKENMINSDLSVNDLAAHCELTIYLLNKKLKTLTGLSANSFIRNIRLKQAAELLVSTNKTISEITFLVGFNDLRYFRSCFSDQFNETPSQYKLRHRSS